MSCSLKKYRDIFGKSGEGVHANRLPFSKPFNGPIIDWLFTVIGAIILSYIFDTGILCMFFILLIISIILHDIFCVNTPLGEAIFGHYPPNISTIGGTKGVPDYQKIIHFLSV